MNKPFYVSPSKLQTFLECPRKYWWMYINPETKSKSPPRSYFSLGNVVHIILDNFFRLNPELRNSDWIKEKFDLFWQPYRGSVGGFHSLEQEAETKNKALRILLDFVERENTTIQPFHHKQDTIFVEIDPTLTFMGRVDRADLEKQGLHVIDYKTGKEREESSLQLPIYAIMIGRKYNKPVIKTSFLFLETGNWKTKEISNSLLDKTIKEVKDIVAKIPDSRQKEDFICPDGDQCRHCDYLKELGIDEKNEIPF